MINKKYSLEEACKKRLIKSGDKANIEALYKPYKTIFVENYFGEISCVSLNSYFDKDELRQAEINVDPDDTIEVAVYKEFTQEKSANLVSSKLLTDKVSGFKASCVLNRDYLAEWKFLIKLNPNIIVRFEGEEENVFLELPPRVAYTIN